MSGFYGAVSPLLGEAEVSGCSKMINLIMGDASIKLQGFPQTVRVHDQCLVGA